MPRDTQFEPGNQELQCKFPGSKAHFLELLSVGFRAGKLTAVDVLGLIGQHSLMSLHDIVSCLFDGRELQAHIRALESADPVFRREAEKFWDGALSAGHVGWDQVNYFRSVLGVNTENVAFGNE